MQPAAVLHLIYSQKTHTELLLHAEYRMMKCTQDAACACVCMRVYVCACVCMCVYVRGGVFPAAPAYL